MFIIRWIGLCLAIVSVSALALSKSGFNYDRKVNIGNLSTPDQLVLHLSEDEFEDYLDYWLHQKYLNTIKIQQRFISTNDGCVIQIQSLKEPTPIFASNGALLHPDGTSGNIHLRPSQSIEASCTGNNNGLVHKSSSYNPSHAIFTCQGGTTITSSWMPNEVDIYEVLCLYRTSSTTINSRSRCSNKGTLINSTLSVGCHQYTVFTSCFDEADYKVLYVEYELNPENVYVQPDVSRPNFNQGTHFPNIRVDRLYKQKSQRNAIDFVLGPNMNIKYINSSYFFSRGHLAAKTDFILAAEQRATFTFVNTAPQWQTFNGGNWNTLEQSLRTRISEGGYRTKIYSGTWDILKLLDSENNLRDIYLSPETKQIPVPLWYYKAVYEPSTQRGIAFLGLNNPYASLQEARELAFCDDLCHDNSDFSWLNWRPTDMRRGYSICCEIDDFRKTVIDLPPFTTIGILS